LKHHLDCPALATYPDGKSVRRFKKRQKRCSSGDISEKMKIKGLSDKDLFSK
jgi:hypothetical protein